MESSTKPLFDTFTLDLGRGCLMQGHDPVHLRPQSYEVLRILVERENRLVSKDDLIQMVWDGRAVTDGSLVKCIEEIREALGSEGRCHLRTVRGRGYIFEPDRRPDRLAPSSVATGTEASSPSRPVRLALVALLLLLGGMVAAWSRTSDRRVSQPITSLAVLPFLNASGDPELEYLSDGIAARLTNVLSTMPGLKVMAHASSSQYTGRHIDPREVGRALHVGAIVIGRVLSQDEDVHVRVELVDTRDGRQLWGGHYSVTMAELQGMEHELEQRIADHIDSRFTHQVGITRRVRTNPVAYQYYLNGLYFLRKERMPQDVRKSLEYFNRAVRVDPDFALAWAGIARANVSLAGNNYEEPRRVLQGAEDAARRALTLDEELVEAHVAMSLLKQARWDWAGAESGYRRAIALNPNDVEAHTWYAWYLSAMGRHSEALAELRHAQALDPLRITLKYREAVALNLAGRGRDAIERVRQAADGDSSEGFPHFALGLSYSSIGTFDRAAEEYRASLVHDGESTTRLCFYGYALAMSGRRSEAEAVLRRLESSHDYVSPAEVAFLYEALGDRASAFAMIEKAYATRDPQVMFLKVDPHYASLRSDPRWAELIRRVGLWKPLPQVRGRRELR